MSKCIIDSDILIYFIKGKQEIVEKLLKIPPQNLYTTRLNYTELIYGAYNSTRVEENLKVVRPFLENFQILEFDQESSEIFAKVKAHLKKNGNIITDMDLMIASIALQQEFSLVSNNIKHFKRIDGLDLIGWL
jgi:predicted nucleic acid-binding protein